ncbi:tripartite tricarboxylate transporter substrate binding protein [Hydrogenophaga sp.]|uniref:tripartite tricarboxylate transporter substrate binding protein n=1 Tax=Hydrogenophaga sp. TaxID=1904254 RepID=UPI003F6FCBBA
MLNHPPKRRHVLLAAVASALPTVTLKAQGQEQYPSRAVKVLVPFVPGGNADSTARIFTEALSRQMGQPFIVENKGGAGGMIGTAAAVKAEPDGYTVLCATPGPILSAWQMSGPSANYSLADMRAVALLTTVPNVLMVNAASPIQDFAGLVTRIKTGPKPLTVGHPGNGTTGHVNLLQLQKGVASEFTVVGYKGSGPAVVDLLGGQLDMVVTDLPSAHQLIKSGKLRAIAAVGRQRAPALPEVRTMAELQLPEVDATNFTAIMAPKGVPDAVVRRLADGVRSALDTDTIRKQIEDLGAIPVRMGTSEFEAFLRQQAATYASLVKAGLLKAD